MGQGAPGAGRRRFAEWGLQLIHSPSDLDTVKASYWIPAFHSSARTDVLPAGVEDVYEFHIGDEVISVVVKKGSIDVHQGTTTATPDVVLRTDPRTFVAFGRGELSVLDAIDAGKLSVDGDQAAMHRCASVFPLSSAGAP